MDEKGEFLKNIRSALGLSEMEIRGREQGAAIFPQADDSHILERIRYRTHVEKQALLQVLEENCKQLNLGIHTVASSNAAADAIINIVNSTSPEFSSIRQIIQHDNAELVELQLWKKLAGESLQIHTSYPADPEVREKTIASYIGITSPQWVIAESATIIQLTEPGQPRSTSLVPSVHIAVFRLKQLLANLTELYALLRKEPPKDSFTLITGPSKTADIEAHMVHGAHGPREMHLVVIDEQLSKNTNFKGSGLFSS